MSVTLLKPNWRCKGRCQSGCKLCAAIPQIMRLRRQKDEQLGFETWIPPLLDCTAVFGVSLNGGAELDGALLFKRVEEFIVVAADPLVLRAAFGRESYIREKLQERGARDMIGFVPDILLKNERTSGMGAMMERLKMEPVFGYRFFAGEI